MAPLTQEETEQLCSRILESLQSTPYACSTLTRLTKGTTNFVFRGNLITPLCDETSTITSNSVIIKHAAEFVAVNQDFPLDVSRSVSITSPFTHIPIAGSDESNCLNLYRLSKNLCFML